MNNQIDRIKFEREGEKNLNIIIEKMQLHGKKTNSTNKIKEREEKKKQRKAISPMDEIRCPKCMYVI